MIHGEAPNIDGTLDDAAWNQVEWGGNFTQRMPEDGVDPSQQTSFKILYDAKNLYVGIRAHDSEPEKIVKRLSRRDGFEGDWVEVNIDSYFDKRTAFSFTATAAGVKGDEYIVNNGDNWDENWDPIWYLRTSIDSEGWTAEMKIPLSQLRFAKKEELTWGLQVNRRYFRNEEMSHWQAFPRDAAGWVNWFGELHGLKGIKPQKQVEIQPYLLAQTERSEKQEGNPFATGQDSRLAVGVDGKIGLTSDITLDFAINPDFGQVEADPSQVNLSAYQIFFSERRPFFIEGNNILDFQVSNSEVGGNFNSDNLFYSRRIGRSPQYFPNLAPGQYADQPNNSRILGAFKLTGKDKKGFSWGILESITAREEAEIDQNGDRTQETVEPTTNYFVGRVQQDWNEGNTFLGAMVTAVNRDIDDPHLDFLHREAYTGGIDFQHNWKERTYQLGAKAIFSHVAGSEEAIFNTQTSNEHLFQRPSAPHLTLDSARTSLSGYGATLTFAKLRGDFVFQTGGTLRSPELELNDMGFMITADQINQWTWGQYRILKPFSIFRSWRMNMNQWLSWDYGGLNTTIGFNVNTHFQFKNYWRIGTGGTWLPRQVSTAELRGGAPFIYPQGLNHWYYIESDQRKKFQGSWNHWRYWESEDAARNRGFNFGFTYIPINALNIRLNSSITLRNSAIQYFATTDIEGETRRLVGSIEQKTYSLSLRVGFNINPDLTLEYWGQPFISRGEYSEFKRITNPEAENFQDRFVIFSPNEIRYDAGRDQYLVDENGNESTDYSFSNPDFHFAQFRSNLVLRWEYIPGSTLFLVWSQDKTGGLGTNPFPEFGPAVGDLFSITGRNILLLKLTYRFRT